MRAANKSVPFELGLVVLLATYLFVAYWHALTLPFLNDDYFLLDKVRGASFWSLWRPEHLPFHWYRPWSREFHYWTLDRYAGLSEVTSHVVSFLLWLGVMVLYFLLARKLAARLAAAVATAGLAALGLWSGPLMWVAGAQDLWMLLFGLAFLHLVIQERALLAVVPLAMGLLSKETAAVLPAIGTAYLTFFRGLSPREVLRRAGAWWGLLLVWMLGHPTLRDRLFGPLRESMETEHRPSVGTTLLKTLLAQINLEDRIAPEIGWWPVAARGVLCAVILGLLLLLARRSTRDAGEDTRPLRAVVFGVLWAMLAWSILLLPSIGWHAYYGVLGSLGCWLALGALLARHQKLALACVVSLAILREARAATPSWDWGTDWYQTRAGAILGSLRERLTHLHPELPPRSRLFFARLPNNVGLLAGDGPAIRIWYGDTTLQARFYSAYVPRSARDTLGRDLFFRFDTVQVLVEIHVGPESIPGALASNPGWQRDHENLAALLIQKGDVNSAAAEYSKLATAFPGRADYALYAGAANEAIGETLQAMRFYETAARAYGMPVVRERAASLVRSVSATRSEPAIP